MQVAIAEPTEGFDEASPGVFLSAVETRRRQVLYALESMHARERVAEFLFDLISHLALNADAVLDAALFDSFARRYRLDDDDGEQRLRLPNGFGPELGLRNLLTRGPVKGAGQDALNALFTQGYAAKLRVLDVVERRNFTLRVVAMLPGAERLGPFVLTDYLDVVCDEDDALRFWQIYVDRVAAEIAKRGGAPEISTREPWLLSRLLALHAEGPMAPRGAWMALTRHVNRILQAHRHRWRFIRHLAEGCHEPRMLCYLCTSPAMVEDPEVIPVFLTRGNSRLVSCALLALHVYRDAHRAVDLVIEQLMERPFAEIASRLIEIHGQLHLFPNIQAGSALDHLRTMLIAVATERIHEAPLDALPNAVPKDSRSLRQNLLLVDLEPAIRQTSPAFAQQYLERVVGTWLQTFTPSGIEHPLNDEVWRGAVRRALIRLAQSDVDGVAERVEQFALGLPAAGERWGEGDALMVQHLCARFVALFGAVWLPVCRALYAEPETTGLGLACYESIVRIFAALETYAQGSGGFGALEYVLPSLYGDLMGAEKPDPQRVAEAAGLVARIEATLYGPAGGQEPSREDLARRPIGLDDDETDFERAFAAERAAASEVRRTWKPASPVELVRDPNAVPLLKRRPSRSEPLRARAWVDRRPTSRLAMLLRAYTGFEVLADVGRRLLRAVGVERAGELQLTEHEVIVTRAGRQGRNGLAAEALSLRLDDVTGVRVQAQFRVFPLVMGGLALAAGALGGGHLVFVGLRGGDTDALVWGAGLVLGGVLFDAALSRLGRENAQSFVLELHGRDARQTIRLVVDAREGAEVLDAFMAHDAARQELENLRGWSNRPSI
jgi:hypothetical protein